MQHSVNPSENIILLTMLASLPWYSSRIDLSLAMSLNVDSITYFDD